MVLEDEFKDGVNTLLLSVYGSSLVLAFRGTADFIARSYNLCHNYEITKGKLLTYDNECSYVLTTREKIKKGLNLYFINEIKMSGQIPLIKDCWNEDESEYLIEYDEVKIKELADIKTDEFITNFIKEDNFIMQNINKSSTLESYSCLKNLSPRRSYEFLAGIRQIISHEANSPIEEEEKDISVQVLES